MRSLPSILLLLVSGSQAFSTTTTAATTKSILSSRHRTAFLVASPATVPFMTKRSEDDPSRLSRIIKRFDTVDAAGFNAPDQPPVLMARGGGFKRTVTFLVLAFAYKWYRARFINKIPVWDRQPQWNMVITSKEQEKDLRAYTCKNCKSTLFIAKNREWFFEGDTGLAGLGCYACGAKGKDNFTMDRDRIVEDVGDMDDYFDYERPLDFVTAAERRALLKKAQGNEELANEMLMAQEKASKGKETSVMEAEVVDVGTPVAEEVDKETPVVAEKTDAIEQEGEPTPPKKAKKAKKAKKIEDPKPEDMDALGLDDF